MSWGSSQPPPPPPPVSAIRKLLPLIVILVLVAGFAVIGYHCYCFAQALTDRGVKKLEKKNVVFTKEGGIRVGVRDVHHERYVDGTQSVLVKAWNLSSWPGYKSRFWNKQAQVQPTAAARK
ncbi:MAG: hypothetical protein M1829_000370 [Trizodia sp. TS-e1964]|nr:MAG: hypothetical protein M1829_000370 [Trizodia sp. TS-e1964]